MSREYFGDFLKDIVIEILEGRKSWKDVKQREGEVKQYVKDFFNDIDQREFKLNEKAVKSIDDLLQDYDINLFGDNYEKSREDVRTIYVAKYKSQVAKLISRTKGLVGRIAKIFSFYCKKSDYDASGIRLIVQHSNTLTIDFVKIYDDKDKDALFRFLEENDPIHFNKSIKEIKFKDLFEYALSLYGNLFEEQNELFQNQIMSKIQDEIEMINTSSDPYAYVDRSGVYRFSSTSQELVKLSRPYIKITANMNRFGIYEGKKREQRDRLRDITGSKIFMENLKAQYPSFSLKMSIKPSDFKTEHSSVDELHLFRNKYNKICMALRREDFIAVYSLSGIKDLDSFIKDKGGKKEFFEDLKGIAKKMFDNDYFKEYEPVEGIVSKNKEFPGQKSYFAHNHEIGYLSHIKGWVHTPIETTIKEILELDRIEPDKSPSILQNKYKDYVNHKKSNDYTGLQGIVLIDGKMVEIQVRTPLQDWIDERGSASKGGYDAEKRKEFTEGLIDWCYNYVPERGRVKQRVETVKKFINLVSDEIKNEYSARYKELFENIKNSSESGNLVEIDRFLEILSDYNERFSIDFPDLNLIRERVIDVDMNFPIEVLVGGGAYGVRERLSYAQNIQRNLESLGFGVQADIKKTADDVLYGQFLEDITSILSEAEHKERDERYASYIAVTAMLMYLKEQRGLDKELISELDEIERDHFRFYKKGSVPRLITKKEYISMRANCEPVKEKSLGIMKGCINNDEIVNELEPYLNKALSIIF